MALPAANPLLPRLGSKDAAIGAGSRVADKVQLENSVTPAMSESIRVLPEDIQDTIITVPDNTQEPPMPKPVHQVPFDNGGTSKP